MANNVDPIDPQFDRNSYPLEKFALASERDQLPPPSYDYHYTAPLTAVNSLPNALNATLGTTASASTCQRFMTEEERYPQSISDVSTVRQSQYIMTDEERYPTVVEATTVTQPQRPALYTHWSADSMSNLSSQLPPTAAQDIMSPLRRNLNDLQKPESIQSSPRKIKILSMPRLIFFCALAAFLAIIIGVGVGVGVWAKNKTTRIRLPAITSSGLFTAANNTLWFSQVYHVNASTGEVQYALQTSGRNWTSNLTMNLTIVPEIDAPMSASAMLGSDGNAYLNLFYIKGNDIIVANISCIFPTTTCVTIDNKAITKNITYPVAKDSGLDSIYVKAENSFKVFYHNSDQYVTLLTSLPDGTWNHGETISGKALKGSDITATLIGTKTMNVLYVDIVTKTLFGVLFDNHWRNPSSIEKSDIPNWDPFTAFTTAYQSANDTLHLFFTGSDKLIYEIVGTNSSTDTFAEIARGDLQPNSTTGISTPGWSQETPYHDLSWLPSDSVGAEIASLGWDNEVRVYRMVDGRIAVGALTNELWSAALV